MSRQKSQTIVSRAPILTVYIVQDNGRFMAKCVELDLVTEMDTPDAGLKAIVEMIKEYAQDYRRRNRLYLRSPNRAHHKPYVERILACKKEWDLLELIEIRHGRL